MAQIGRRGTARRLFENFQKFFLKITEFEFPYRRDIVIEPAARRRAAIEARGHSELGAFGTWGVRKWGRNLAVKPTGLLQRRSCPTKCRQILLNPAYKQPILMYGVEDSHVILQ